MLLGKDYDGRADLYALAVTVYEALAGAFPFDGPTPAAILLKQSSEAALPLSDSVPSAPSHIVAAVAMTDTPDQLRRLRRTSLLNQRPQPHEFSAEPV